jgi:hypothetical protein
MSQKYYLQVGENILKYLRTTFESQNKQTRLEGFKVIACLIVKCSVEVF